VGAEYPARVRLPGCRRGATRQAPVAPGPRPSSTPRHGSIHVLLLGERHPRRVLAECATYFNGAPPQQGIGQGVPTSPRHPARSGRMRRRKSSRSPCWVLFTTSTAELPDERGWPK